MNRTEALVPFSNASHTKSRSKLKTARNNNQYHHSKYNNYHQYHHHSLSVKHDRANSSTYSNGGTSTTNASHDESDSSFASYSTLSLSPSPSPQAFHASLHNTHHHHHHPHNYYNNNQHNNYQYSANKNKLIPLSLIYGYLRSCIVVSQSRAYKSHINNDNNDNILMDDDFDSAEDEDDDIKLERDIVVDSFDILVYVPSNITQSILLYFDDNKFDVQFGGKQCGSFIWKLSTLQLLTAQRMESIPFQIGSFVWYLSVYPYGIDSEHTNFTNLYINLSSTNATLFTHHNKSKHNTAFLCELVVNARLYCIESASCWSSIKTFKADDDKHGWQKGALLIHELCRYKELTFVVYINVLRIRRACDKQILYQYPLKLNNKSECNQFIIKWKIDEKLLSDLRNANEMKRFESDICSNMWVLGCVPNGIKKDNDASVFKIYLKLCALPPNISKIKVKFNIICIETKKHIKYIYNDFDYKHKYWQTDKLCKRNYLVQNHNLTSLRFKAEIEIIEQYDTNYNELSSNLWKQNIDNGSIQDLITKDPLNISRNSNKLSSYQLKLLIVGFIRRQYLAYTVQNIALLIAKFYPICDDGSFRWNINLEQILKLSKLNAKQRFDSKIFTISNLKWFLQIYPNGYRPEDEGFCSVYLILAYLPSILKEITIHFCVYCPQTMSNFSTIHTFNHSRDGRGTRRMLSLQHLNNIYHDEKVKKKNGFHDENHHRFITFNCRINILRIRNDRHHIIYQYPLTLNPANYKALIYSHFKWKINEKMMKKFKQSNNGQRFESKIFNEMWNLSIFPNENKNKNSKLKMLATKTKEEEEEANVVIGIRLCALPKDISKIKVHYKLLCVEFEEAKKKKKNITYKWSHCAVFDYDNYYVKFPKHTIPAQILNTFNQLTFKADIHIIELYDANQKIIKQI